MIAMEHEMTKQSTEALSVKAMKMAAAKAALSYIQDDMVVGIGSGSTVDCLIEQLAAFKTRVEAFVPSSLATEKKLKTMGLPVLALPAVSELDLYIDSADECCLRRHVLIKGGGGALTREKILAYAAKSFICLLHDEKCVEQLGAFPLAVEVIPIARSLVGRRFLAAGAQPVYREDYVTDNHNIILDVYGLDYTAAKSLETDLKSWIGVVETGLFAQQFPDLLLKAEKNGEIIKINPIEGK